MLHVRSVTLQASAEMPRGFPWSIPSIQALVGRELEFTAPVTFFVGENGSGKSTLLEALACAAQSIAVGSEDLGRDQTLDAVRDLANQLKLVWSKRTRKGFFMRSEDFFGYAKRLHEIRVDSESALDELEQDQSLSPLSRALARQPHANTLHALQHKYGAGLDSYSHGESFLTLFKSRFTPNGLYLLDEPEAPLSPQRQLALLSMIKSAVEQQNAQFMIATHSPILMAFPGAVIWSFDHGTVREVGYDQVEHVTFMRDFLQSPGSFLRHL